jgi:hypothetical protein
VTVGAATSVRTGTAETRKRHGKLRWAVKAMLVCSNWPLAAWNGELVVVAVMAEGGRAGAREGAVRCLL